MTARRLPALATLALGLGVVAFAPAAARGAAQITIVNTDGPNEGFNDPTAATPVGGNTGTTDGQQRLMWLDGLRLGRWRSVFVLDRCDEHVATTVDRPDDSLVAAGVAHGASHGLDLCGQRRFAHEPVAPHRVEQFVLGDHAIAMLDQLDQDAHRLWLQRHRLPTSPELDSIEIEHTVLEPPAHHRPGAPIVVGSPAPCLMLVGGGRTPGIA